MASPDTSWQCLTCTLVNPISQTSCSACENRRPAFYDPPQVADPMPVTQQATPATKPNTTANAAATATARAGLSLEERQAREKEMAAKRQKKEEEKALIMRQAEADRRARETLHGTPASQIAAAAAQSQASSAKPAHTQSSTVRLQVRCPHWSRAIVLTCFGPENTLRDVRQRIREELISGVTGTEDGRSLPDAETQRARVPAEDVIVLVETVPPRRRFSGTEDMQKSLREAGLCPSGTLIAEAPPVEVEAPAPEGEPRSAAAQESSAPSRTEAREGEDAESDDPDSDDDQYDSADDSDSGASSPFPTGGVGRGLGRGTGSGTFAGAGPGRSGAGRFGGNAPFGPRRMGPGRRDAQPQFPASGGQVLGSASDINTGTVVPGGAALVAAAAAGQLPQTTDADARAARLAALERRGLGVGSSSASTSGSNAAASQLLHKEPGRVAGQMGAGVDKATRAKEREQILRQMQEDREDYIERRGVAAADVAAASAAAEKSASSCVRLQIRCSISGRSLVSMAYAASNQLQEVHDFAVKELTDESSPPVALILGYPPWTDFTDSLNRSIGDLGLAPAATLLLKAVKVEEAAADGPSAAASEAAAAQDGTAEEQVAIESPACDIKCPGGHVMTVFTTTEEAWCDKCGCTLPEGTTPVYECRSCDYVQCQSCSKS